MTSLPKQFLATIPINIIPMSGGILKDLIIGLRCISGIGPFLCTVNPPKSETKNPPKADVTNTTIIAKVSAKSE